MSIKKILKYTVPVSFKKHLKYIFYSVEDGFNKLTGRHPKGYPPKRLNFVGSHDFKTIGDEFTKRLIEDGGLKPTDTVLDIGSGIGRIELPLTKYLTDGKLHGFDIDKKGVTWCQKNITPKHPHFHFHHADIYNKYYNKKGSIQANAFTFPFSGNKFDLVFATSVFTHMLPDQIDQYLSEISRVLKSGGTCFITWFILNDKARQNIEKGLSNANMTITLKSDLAYYSHKDMPEAEIGFEEKWIHQKLRQYGLDKDLQILPGYWSNPSKKENSYQDIIISKKI